MSAEQNACRQTRQPQCGHIQIPTKNVSKMVKEMEIMLIAIVGLCMVTFLEAFPQNSSGNKGIIITNLVFVPT